MIDLLYSIVDDSECTNIFRVQCSLCTDELRVPDSMLSNDSISYTIACLCYSEKMGICIDAVGRVAEVKGNPRHCMIYNDKLKQYVRL